MRILPFLALIAASPVAAHEFWIEPQAYAIGPDDTVIADTITGQDFSGPVSSYLPDSFKRFDITVGATTEDVTGRAGDRPAVNQQALGEGLHIIVHQTNVLGLTYTEWEKFVGFAEHKDFTEVLDLHKARGLPETGFVEAYTRYAKSLVAVGSGAGADQIVGMRTEIVAEANPYTDDLTEGLPVQVLLDGAPRADVQIELFAKKGEAETVITLHRTDAEGRATLPLAPGTEYLVDAVAMEPVRPANEGGPVWHSLWASLTFQTPE